MTQAIGGSVVLSSSELDGRPTLLVLMVTSIPVGRRFHLSCLATVVMPHDVNGIVCKDRRDHYWRVLPVDGVRVVLFCSLLSRGFWSWQPLQAGLEMNDCTNIACCVFPLDCHERTLQDLLAPSNTPFASTHW